MTMTVTTTVRSRRERLRQQTTDEIRDMAREHLVKRGPQGISLRAVARDVGLSAPALYRYFPSLDDLVTDLIVTCIDELTRTLEAARDAIDPDKVPARLAAVSRAFRAWAVRHPAEFSLVFGSPAPGYNAPADGPTAAAGRRFGAVFAGLFAELWARQPFPVQTPDELGPRLLRSMSGHHQIVNEALPPGAVTVFTQCYTRLYGIITMEVFGHLSWALDDVEPLFERELDGLCQLVHTTYTPPQGLGTAATPPARR
jgi:AcrR family transcriptional regulator